MSWPQISRTSFGRWCPAALGIAVILLLSSCLDATGTRGGTTVNPILPPTFGYFASRFRLNQALIAITSGRTGGTIFQARQGIADPIVLPVTVGHDSLLVSITYEAASGEAFYRGQTGVVVNGAAISLPVIYVGAGATATNLIISPPDPVVQFGDSVQLVAKALDGRGDSVPIVELYWQSDDGSLAADPSGKVVAADRPGEAVFYGTLPNGVSAFDPVLFSARPFAVLPDSLELLPGSQVLFRTFGGAPTTSVWAVNGQVGGDSSTGVASSGGSYAAPLIPPSPSTVSICDQLAADTACARATITTPPSAGTDVVVLGDLYPMSNTGMAFPGNRALARQLVSYSASGARAFGNIVLWDRSRNPHCKVSGTCSDSALRQLESELVAAGMTVQRMDSLKLPKVVPAGIKVIFEWTPGRPYNEIETNALKRFAREGGRIVLLTDDTTSYGVDLSAGLFAGSDLLSHMGTTMTLSPVNLDCAGPVDEQGGAIRAHQTTQGIAGIRVSCGLGIATGTNGYALVQSQSYALLAVAKIDPTPVLRFGCSCGGPLLGRGAACRCQDNSPHSTSR